MMLLKVSSASGAAVREKSGEIHPLFNADPAVRHTFVLGVDSTWRLLRLSGITAFCCRFVMPVLVEMERGTA
jgi:hypothetical protein